MERSPSSSTSPHTEARIIAVGILLILLIGIYFFGRTLWQEKQQEQAEYQNLAGIEKEVNYPTITPESLQKMMSTPNEKFTIIDIRARDLYLLSHLPHALSYPDTSITTFTLPANKLIIIGNDSNESVNEQVANYLNEKGANFAFLKGGQTTWSTLNQPLVTTGNPASFVDQSKIKYVTTDEVKKRFQAGEKVFVLDVQPADRYRTKHLKDAVNIPVAELESQIGELPSGQKILVYGTNEAEAFQAGVILFDLNIFGAEVIEGDQVLDSGLFTEAQ